MPVIISNYADDIIEYKNNFVISGGPALYIEKYYIHNKLDYKIITGEGKGNVIIYKKNGDDIGIIKKAPIINIKEKIKSDFFIISTLCDEFNLKNTIYLDGYIFLDIQGYIRELNSIERKKINTLEGIENIDFIKISDYELLFLTDSFINNYINLGGNIIITTGKKGFIKILNKEGEKIIKTPIGDFYDTIGAGDTFLSCFAYNFNKTKNIEKSILNSSEYVFNFLKLKNKF